MIKQKLILIISLTALLMSLVLLFHQSAQKKPNLVPYFVKMNTSNLGKLKEYQRLFNQQNIGLIMTKIDLDEIEADPLTVILHKASQLEEGVIVEDTSLEVDGTDIGVNIRWLVDDLGKYLGRDATWTLFLAYRKNDNIYVFKGEVLGKIVEPQSTSGFGFDPYFQPNGTEKTLAEEKPDAFNARALAVKALTQEKPFIIQPAIYHWDGLWQEHK